MTTAWSERLDELLDGPAWCDADDCMEPVWSPKARRCAGHRPGANAVLINTLKNVPCMDCERRFPLEAMDFDHRDPARKMTNVGMMKAADRDELLAEIAKCDVVCSNCHRTRTVRRAAARRRAGPDLSAVLTGVVRRSILLSHTQEGEHSMGVTFAGTSSSAGAPDVEAGIYDGRFDGVSAKEIKNSPFDPNVFEWAFTLMADGQVLYDEGEPIEVTGLTSRSMNVKSKTTPKAVKWLKALMTTAEFAGFEQGEKIDGNAIVGRPCQLVVGINANGWPVVEDVLAAKKGRGSIKPKAEAAE